MFLWHNKEGRHCALKVIAHSFLLLPSSLFNRISKNKRTHTKTQTIRVDMYIGICIAKAVFLSGCEIALIFKTWGIILTSGKFFELKNGLCLRRLSEFKNDPDFVLMKFRSFKNEPGKVCSS